ADLELAGRERVVAEAEGRAVGDKR
ncbi:MAG: hypothetical protein JWO31_1380, partial [Phycisphaerales bacterium]|nr:hypothetical protein [Phycisphaerales bacterium]